MKEIFTFGKYKGKSYLLVAVEDGSYFVWAYEKRLLVSNPDVVALYERVSKYQNNRYCTALDADLQGIIDEGRY